MVSRHWLPWPCLGAMLILFLFYLRCVPAEAYFGGFRDDALYFSFAKAIARGEGFVIPSLPGSPPQTKYPFFYPWLLSWVWRLHPSFPSNIALATWVTAIFGCWFLVAAFELLRRPVGLGAWAALGLVSLCAFEPHVLILSRAVLSDVPFAALALTAALVGDEAMEVRVGTTRTVIAGILAGLSVVTRSIGVVVVAGLVAAALHRRAYRRASLLCLVTAPFLVVSYWASWPSPGSAGGLAYGLPSALPGWQQELLYYTSYSKFWRLCVPNWGVFSAMLGGNLRSLAAGPALYLLAPTLAVEKSLVFTVVASIATAGAVAGIVRQARSKGCKPIHFILAFYTPVILMWNYPILDRFLLPFMPLFFAGWWVEGKYLFQLVLGRRGGRCSVGDKAIGGVMLMAISALAGVALWNYRYGYRSQMPGAASQRAFLAAEKAQACDWIRRNTQPTTRIVAYEEASLYLYTGRQSVSPMAFSTEYVYTRDESVLERDLGRLTDAANAVGAQYWLVSPDDFDLELEAAQPRMKERVARLMSVTPEVCRSQSGQVRLYDISRLLRSQGSGR